MDRGKRASMREGPLAQLFRRTDEDAPPQPAEQPPAEQQPPEQQPTEQPPASSESAQPAPTESAPAEPATTDPAATEPPSASATAQNQAAVWQAIFEVQQGCRSYCQGTSQSQSAVQLAETIQSATAIGGGTGSPSDATALNQSTTGQFIWQVQLGCVAFCYGTSQSQTASQWAQTTQNATAISDGTARAYNVGSVIQQIWQLQFGCEVECHGTSQTQSSTQGQSTSQSAGASSETWGAQTAIDARSLLPAWLIALAENLGVTIQTVWQYQETACLERCVGDSQTQEAAQRVLTTHDARAVAGVPPEEPAPPAAGPPPDAGASPSGASIASASPNGANQNFFERAAATWWGASRNVKSGSRIRRRASVTTSSHSSRPDATVIETTVEASARAEAGSSSATARTSTSTEASASATARTTDSPSVDVQRLSGLPESGSDDSRTGWLLLGLLALMGVGAGIVRKSGPRRAAA